VITSGKRCARVLQKEEKEGEPKGVGNDSHDPNTRRKTQLCLVVEEGKKVKKNRGKDKGTFR